MLYSVVMLPTAVLNADSCTGVTKEGAPAALNASTCPSDGSALPTFVSDVEASASPPSICAVPVLVTCSVPGHASADPDAFENITVLLNSLIPVMAPPMPFTCVVSSVTWLVTGSTKLGLPAAFSCSSLFPPGSDAPTFTTALASSTSLSFTCVCPLSCTGTLTSRTVCPSTVSGGSVMGAGSFVCATAITAATSVSVAYGCSAALRSVICAVLMLVVAGSCARVESMGVRGAV